jgi:hypothetical protein
MDELHVPYENSYPNLEKALKDGAKIHIFGSGGSLRVVRVEKNGELISYGEHPYLSGALSYAETDFGLSYEERKKAKRTHYLTGAYPCPSDLMDIWIHSGKVLDIYYSHSWGCIICTRPVESRLNRKNEILWGTSHDSVVGAISACLLCLNFEDEKSFKERAGL